MSLEIPICEACGHPHFAGGRYVPGCITCRPRVTLPALGTRSAPRPRRRPPPVVRPKPSQFKAADGSPLPEMLNDALHRQFRRDGEPRQKYGATIDAMIAARKAKKATQDAGPEGPIPTHESEVADGSADG